MKNEYILLLAEKVANKLNLSIRNKKQILKTMKSAISTTTFAFNSNSIVWIDKLYIAYSTIDSADVFYIYVTKKYIIETMGGIKYLLRTSLNFLDYTRLSNELEQLRKALSYMVVTGQVEYIFEDNLRSLLGGEDS